MALENVDILNQALILCGARTVASTSDLKSSLGDATTLIAQKRNEIFDMPIDWRFCTVRAELTKHTETPPNGGWLYYYAIPAKLRRLIEVIDEDGDTLHYPWRRELSVATEGETTTETPVFACNEDEMHIRYIYLVENPDLWPSWFFRLVVCNLAMTLMEPLKQDKGQATQKVMMAYEDALRSAKAANYAENTDTHKGQNTDLGNTDVAGAAYSYRRYSRDCWL